MGPARRTSTPRRAEGAHADLQEMKPAEINETCMACHNRGTHAGWTGSAHETRNLSCTTCPQRAQPEGAEVPAGRGHPHRTVRHMPSPAGRQDGTGGRAHAGARRQDGVRDVPQPARLDQQRQGAEGRQLVSRAVHELPHGDARADAVGARAGARELRDLPRPAWIVERPHAGRAHADAVSAMPRRQPASLLDLRQRGDHDEQEQSHVRRSCVNCHSNVHGSNHPSGQFYMR
jgi:hypothetical protein